MDALKMSGITRVLPKPYELGALEATVKEIIGTSS
jgi:hypothetical protein